MKKDLFAGGERQKLWQKFLEFSLKLERVVEKNYHALFIYVSLRLRAGAC